MLELTWFSFLQFLFIQTHGRAPQPLPPPVIISRNAFTDTPNCVPQLPDLVMLTIEINHLRSPRCELETPVALCTVHGFSELSCDGDTVAALYKPLSSHPNPFAATSEIRTVHPSAQS